MIDVELILLSAPGCQPDPRFEDACGTGVTWCQRDHQARRSLRRAVRWRLMLPHPCIKNSNNPQRAASPCFRIDIINEYIPRPMTRIIVFLADDTRQDDLDPWKSRLGVTSITKLESLNVELWRLPSFAGASSSDLESELDRLKASGLVDLAAVDSKIQLTPRTYSLPNDPGLKEIDFYGDPTYKQWSLVNIGEKRYWDHGPYRLAKFDADIDAPEAWQYVDSLPGEPSTTIVAVFDTGIDWLHPDLIQNMWVNNREIAGNRKDDDNNGYVDDVYGYNFFKNTSDPMDVSDSGHGTHVAGIIGATSRNGVGIAGVNPYAKLMAVSIPGRAQMSEIVKAIDYSVKMGATVANHSWGWTGERDNDAILLEQAFVRAGKAGQLIVTAAGNDITNTDTVPDWPTNIKIPQKISVASTNALDELSGFSNYAPGMVEIAAPGSDIYSTLPRVKGQYGNLDGTSMSSPLVAGVASLVKSAYPDLSPEQIRNRILKGVDKLTGLQTVVSTSGRLNAFKAVYQNDGDPLTEFTVIPQWKGASGMRLWPSGEIDDNDYTGYPGTSWGITGTFINDQILSMTFMDVPRFYKPIKSAVFSANVGSFWSNDAVEKVELRVNPALSPDMILQTIDQSYSQPGAVMHKSLQAGKLIGALEIAIPASGYGQLDRTISIKINKKGIVTLNRFAKQGRPFVLSLGLAETPIPEPVYGTMDNEYLNFSGGAEPSLQLLF